MLSVKHLVTFRSSPCNFPWPVGNAAGIGESHPRPASATNTELLGKSLLLHRRSYRGFNAPGKNISLHKDFPLGHGGFGWLLHRVSVAHLQFSSGPQLLHFTLNVFKTNNPSRNSQATSHSPSRPAACWCVDLGKILQNLSVLPHTCCCRNQVALYKNPGV